MTASLRLVAFRARAPLAAALVAAAATTARAQTGVCTVERCGLWMPHVYVAEGAAATRVQKGLFVPHVAALAAASDSVRAHYRAARRLGAVTGVLSGITTAALLGELAAYPNKQHPRWTQANRIWLPATTVVSFVAAVVTGRRSEDHLRRAAWLYNATLPNPAPESARIVMQGCPYERCALRLQQRTWSTWIVQGASDTPVARLGYRAPELTLFADAGDSARVHYDAYRSAHAVAAPVGRFVLWSLLGSGAAFLSSRSDGAQGAGTALLVLGYAVGHLSLGALREERGELERAIWEYNRTLPTGR